MPWFLYLYIYTQKQNRPSKGDPMIFISHCSANWERYEMKENDSSLHCLFCWAPSCDPNSPTVKSVPLILLSVCQSIETLFLIHDLHITSGAGPLFYSNDQHNILMWSSKLCWVKINRVFLHPALFFLSPAHPFKSQLHFPPTPDTPQGSGWTAAWKGATALPRNAPASAEERPFPGASLRQTVLCSQEQDWNPVTLNP